MTSRSKKKPEPNHKPVEPPGNLSSFYIETYGCQMNEYDSLVAQKILEDDNAKKVDNAEQADLILLNTCAVRENAHTKIYNRLNGLNHLRRKGKKIGILGCMAQNLREELLYADLPVDFIMGPDAFRQLKNNRDARVAFLELNKQELYDDLVPTVEHHLGANRSPVSAFVSIQRGCNNFCSFCVVPYTRGRERSRPVESIVQEVQKLAEGNVKSVALLGQNVNSYRHHDDDFTSLLKSILSKTDIERIFFTSPHPKDFAPQLVDLIANEPRLGKQVHIPLQSGSDDILKKMKRNYTREGFLRLVDSFRKKVKDVHISTDVIVGFPTETPEDFELTRKTMQQAAFDSAFMFAYSQRKGTIAARLYEDDVSETIKKQRLETIIEEQTVRSLRSNDAYIGRELEVIAESSSKRDDQQLSGRAINGKKVVFSLEKNKHNGNIQQYIGKSYSVKIEKVTAATLIGSQI